MAERDDGIGEVERKLGGDEAELAQIQATLKRLREVRRRIARRQLEPDDLALFLALLDEETETR